MNGLKLKIKVLKLVYLKVKESLNPEEIEKVILFI